MGVDRTTYVVYGVKLPYEPNFYERFEEIERDFPGYVCIIDGMSGEYAVIGLYIDRSDSDGSGWHGRENHILSLPSMSEEKHNQVYSRLKEWFPDQEIAPQYLVIDDWS